MKHRSLRWNDVTDSDNLIDFSIGGFIIPVVGAMIVSYLYTLLSGKRGM